MGKIFLVIDKADHSIVDAFESRDDALHFCEVKPTDVEYEISDLWVQPRNRVTGERAFQREYLTTPFPPRHKLGCPAEWRGMAGPCTCGGGNLG